MTALPARCRGAVAVLVALAPSVGCMDFDALDRCARVPCGQVRPEFGASDAGPDASGAGDGEVFAADQPDVFALARGSGTLYWASRAPNGRVAACPLAACTRPTVILSGVSPTAIAWSKRALWTDDREPNLHFTNDAGGIGAADVGQPALWVTADRDAFVIQKNGTLIKVTGDPPADRTTFLPFTTVAERASTHADAVAWTGRDGSVHACLGECATEAESIVAAQDQAATAIALDSRLLFWTTGDGRIRSAARTTTSFGRKIVELASGLPELSEIAPDASGGALYFTARGTATAGYADGIVGKIPKEGGAVTVLARRQARPEGIVVTETHVYWANYNDGTIRRAPK